MHRCLIGLKVWGKEPKLIPFGAKDLTNEAQCKLDFVTVSREGSTFFSYLGSSSCEILEKNKQ